MRVANDLIYDMLIDGKPVDGAIQEKAPRCVLRREPSCPVSRTAPDVAIAGAPRFTPVMRLDRIKNVYDLKIGNLEDCMPLAADSCNASMNSVF